MTIVRFLNWLENHFLEWVVVHWKKRSFEQRKILIGGVSTNDFDDKWILPLTELNQILIYIFWQIDFAQSCQDSFAEADCRRCSNLLMLL